MAAAMQGRTVRDFLSAQTNKIKCFNCGQTGHCARNCSEAPKRETKKAPGLCPKCKRGNHWASECRSKRDYAGHPLNTNLTQNQGNGKQGRPQAPEKWGQRVNFLHKLPAATIHLNTPQSHSRECRIGPLFHRLHSIDPQHGSSSLAHRHLWPPTCRYFGLSVGRSSSTMEGLMIYPGVTDSDYTGEISHGFLTKKYKYHP